MELLLDVIYWWLLWIILIGFVLGVVVMLLFKVLVCCFEVGEVEDLKIVGNCLLVSLLLVFGLDIVLDGLLIGVSFVVGEW